MYSTAVVQCVKRRQKPGKHHTYYRETEMFTVVQISTKYPFVHLEKGKVMESGLF
jgi:hypothetical protein